MKSWNEFEHGMFIGPKDSLGNKLALGDEVVIKQKIALPNEEGWGRSIPPDPFEETQYQTIERHGKIVYYPEYGIFKIKENNSSNTFSLSFEGIYKK